MSATDVPWADGDLTTGPVKCPACGAVVELRKDSAYMLHHRRPKGGGQCDPRNDPAYHVVRYVVTHINKSGVRVLTNAQQGRFTYATTEEAQQRLDGIKPNHVHGDTMEVRPVKCWPVHFDPKTCYFN